MNAVILLTVLLPLIATTPPDPRPVPKLPSGAQPKRETPYPGVARLDDAAATVVEELQSAKVTRYVRYERLRESGSESERYTLRDSARVDAAWLARFEDLCGRLSLGVCRPWSLAVGKSDRYDIRIEAMRRKRPLAVELDFGAHCARFIRDGSQVASRSMEGAELALLALLQTADPGDAALDELALRFTTTPTPEAVGQTRTDDGMPSFGDYVHVDEMPEPIHKPRPNLPQLAKEAGVQGTVTVQALVGRDGKVRDVRVTKGIPMLDQAAVECVRQWVFKPAMSKGAPVAVWVAVPLKFEQN